MSMEMNKALDLLREIRPSIPKEVLELWCKDRDAFLASHPEVEQAGGDRWDALQSIMEWTAAKNIPDDRKLCLIRNAARAALAQPSPVPERPATFSVPSCENSYGFGYVDCTCIQSLRGYRDHLETIVDALPEGELMTVAQHNRILDTRWNRAMDLMGEHVSRISEKFKAERDAALARVAELETALEPFAAVADAYDDSEDDDHEPYTDMGCDDRLRLTLGQHRAGRIALEGRTPQAQAQHSVPEGWKLVPVDPTEDVLEAIHNGGYVGDDQELRWFYQSILAAAPAPGGE
ncbi:hypothetical protein RYG61_005390 [Pseudomonas aeruginosa]|nr:hypothetical protein [Pseudomonas aeruginosa]